MRMRNCLQIHWEVILTSETRRNDRAVLAANTIFSKLSTLYGKVQSILKKAGFASMRTVSTISADGSTRVNLGITVVRSFTVK